MTLMFPLEECLPTKGQCQYLSWKQRSLAFEVNSEAEGQKECPPGQQNRTWVWGLELMGQNPSSTVYGLWASGQVA